MGSPTTMDTSLRWDTTVDGGHSSPFSLRSGTKPLFPCPRVCSFLRPPSNCHSRHVDFLFVAPTCRALSFLLSSAPLLFLAYSRDRVLICPSMPTASFLRFLLGWSSRVHFQRSFPRPFATIFLPSFIIFPFLSTFGAVYVKQPISTWVPLQLY